MKKIKGFENEDIIVSDFGEWVGKNYIDYKYEYENNQKIIKRLLDESKQLKDNWNKLKEYCKENTLCYEVGDDENTKLIGSRIHGLNVLDKMQELEQGSDSNG